MVFIFRPDILVTEIDGDDVETCNDAIELCRKEVLELERELKKCEV